MGNLQCNKKRTVLPRHLKKIFYLGYFPKYSGKRVLCPLGHIFNKVNRGIVKKPDEVGS